MHLELLSHLLRARECFTPQYPAAVDLGRHGQISWVVLCGTNETAPYSKRLSLISLIFF